jgi:methylmalonyl-CoA mutase N-terminal domain/subunit
MKDVEGQRISEAEEEWALAAEEGLKARKAEVREVVNDIGMKVKPLYTPNDVQDIDYLRDIGFPGQYPFTRGIYPYMYRTRPWGTRQYSGFGTAEDTNQRWKSLIAAGQRGVSLASDLATQFGYDSDMPEAEGEVGRLGLHIDTLKDMEILFDGIPLDKTAVTCTLGTVGSIFVAMLVATAEKKGVPPSQITGTLGNELLVDYIGRGSWIYPIEDALRLAIDVAEYAIHNMPQYYPFNIPYTGILWCSNNLAQEAGYGFAITDAIITRALKRGIDIDDLAPKISGHYSIGVHFLEGAAMLRAARKVWAKLMKEKYGAKSKESLMLRFTGSATGIEFSGVEPELNLVRAACVEIGCALGGAQHIFTPSMDEAFAIPTEKASRWSLMISQILSEETDLTATADPLGGSYYIEALTHQYEKAILEKMGEIDRVGGMVKAIESGYIQRQLTAAALEYQRGLESGKRVRVGENKYVVSQPQEPLAVHQYDPGVAQRQAERLRKVKAERDQNQVSRCLEEVRTVAKDGTNLMPALIEAVKAYATMGEITAVLKDTFSEWQQPRGVF